MDFRVLFLIAMGLAATGFAENIASPTTLTDKKRAAERSLDLARRAVALEPKNARAHVELAIALGKMTDFTDNRTKMSYARQIRSEAETGLQLDPQNTEACLILGKWHDEMSRLNPILKAIATTLYGKLPDASLSEAEKYLRRAIATAPENIQTRGEWAEFLERQNRASEARIEWQKIRLLTPRDDEDRTFAAKAKTLHP